MVCIVYKLFMALEFNTTVIQCHIIILFYEFSKNVRLLEELNKYMLLQQCIRKLNCSCVNIKCTQLLNAQLQINIYGT